MSRPPPMKVWDLWLRSSEVLLSTILLVLMTSCVYAGSVCISMSSSLIMPRRSRAFWCKISGENTTGLVNGWYAYEFQAASRPAGCRPSAIRAVHAAAPLATASATTAVSASCSVYMSSVLGLNRLECSWKARTGISVGHLLVKPAEITVAVAAHDHAAPVEPNW